MLGSAEARPFGCLTFLVTKPYSAEYFEALSPAQSQRWKARGGMGTSSALERKARGMRAIRAFPSGDRWLVDFGSYACGYYETRGEAVEAANCAAASEHRGLVVEAEHSIFAHPEMRRKA